MRNVEERLHNSGPTGLCAPQAIYVFVYQIHYTTLLYTVQYTICM
jgi:hypothetical protein